ncbi:MAG: GIY-YIG nuclease family protein [Pseudomonadota bacterium]
MPSFVYFIKPIGMQGPVKIGVSYTPIKRLRQLETFSPFGLELLVEVEGDKRLERAFHALFLHSHTRHEWFDWTPELQATIDALEAGTFDFESLPKGNLGCITSKYFRMPTPVEAAA